MKTKYISSFLVMSLMVVVSCKKELEPQDNSGSVIPSSGNNTLNTPVTPGLTTPPQNASLQQQNINSNSAGMNPAHGQPGHRCDIAVGAPLNSPPGKSAAASNTSVTNSSVNATVPTIVKSNPTAVVTKPGMNPPHGQAGHRCDISVGAPLNSPPGKTTPAATTTESKPEVPALLKVDTTGTTQ